MHTSYRAKGTAFSVTGMAIVPVLLSIVLAGCAQRAETAEAPSPECQALQKTVTHVEQAFIQRVKEIRGQHLLIRDYDQLMIDAITQRRDALQSTTLMGMSVTNEVAGCRGKALDDMRRSAQREMADLRVFLNTFKRALKTDPPGVYIDEAQ